MTGNKRVLLEKSSNGRVRVEQQAARRHAGGRRSLRVIAGWAASSRWPPEMNEPLTPAVEGTNDNDAEAG
jgi:hypothetical protein